jgi:hypothetical protein
MPFVSKAQQRWGNSPAGRKALGAAGVAEWNAATKGKKLPARKAPKKKNRSGILGIGAANAVAPAGVK